MLESIRKLRKHLADPYVVPYLSDVTDHLDAIEQEVSERYVELPLDANGVPIHIGDTLQGERCGGGWCEPFKVERMAFRADGWSVYEACGYGHIAGMCRHQPDSWERIESEARDWMQRNGTPNGVMHFIERCRALAGDAE